MNSSTHYPEKEREQLPRPALERADVIFSATEIVVLSAERQRALIDQVQRTEAASLAALNALEELKAISTEHSLGLTAVEPADNDLVAAQEKVNRSFDVN